MLMLFGKDNYLNYHFWTMDYALDQLFCDSAQRFYGATKIPKEGCQGMLSMLFRFYIQSLFYYQGFPPFILQF